MENISKQRIKNVWDEARYECMETEIDMYVICNIKLYSIQNYESDKTILD